LYRIGTEKGKPIFAIHIIDLTELSDHILKPTLLLIIITLYLREL
jgi:hypothetical protein